MATSWTSLYLNLVPQSLQLGTRDPTLRTCWGYTFYLTPEHMGEEESSILKQSSDVLADRAYAVLASLPSVSQSEKSEANPQSDGLVENKAIPPSEVPTVASAAQQDDCEPVVKPKAKRDLYVLLRDNISTDPDLQALWTQANTVPDWVDWEQIARGQEVFYRYGGPALMGLAFQSLLGGMGAGRVVETLTRTGGFSTRVARHRLLETTQHILQCTRSLTSLQPGGEGFASSIRVRLLHAAVRSSILKLASEDPSYYDVSALGIPINDLDCIATIVTFSSSLIWISFPRQGIFISAQEAADYIALWRYIAYLSGTPESYFATPASARRAMETLMLYEIAPTDTSQVLAHNVIECLALQPPNYPSREFLEAFARWLNGSELCDALGLGRPGWYHWMLVAGQVLFSMTMTYSMRTFRGLDRRKIALLRKVFWNIIVEGKEGLGSETVFDYKYIPRLGKLTKPGKGWKHEKARNQTERRNLIVFVGATLTAASIGLVLLRVVPSVVIAVKSAVMRVVY